MNSVHMKIIYGFPQGYIPGTLLFIIFINDVPNASNLFKIILLFADATNVIASHSNKGIISPY